MKNGLHKMNPNEDNHSVVVRPQLPDQEFLFILLEITG